MAILCVFNAPNMNIGDGIETMARKQAFITLKDHKANFENNHHVD